MVYYDHAMLGATVAVAAGAQRRHGWPVVVLAALAGMFPDWDALAIHISPETYQIGHRVWGHNLFAVTLAGILLGGLGYWIHQSQPNKRNGEPAGAPSRAGPWIGLAVLILWSHASLDFLYCSWEGNTDWPVGLLWPLVSEGFGQPWIPWRDWGATILLLGALFGIFLVRDRRQRLACQALLLLGFYIAARGALRQWG